MRTINVDKVTENIKEMCIEATHFLSLDMKEALNNLSVKPEHVLIDAVKLDIDIPSTSIIKGDAKSQSIAAASIMAKVTRDRMMYELDKEHPEYDFAHNKGYGTKKHIEAIRKYGILKEHRKSFAPCNEYDLKA